MNEQETTFLKNLIRSPSDFTDGDLAAVRFRDNWDGEGYICETIAQWRDGEWWPYEGGDRLLKYEGSKILQIWPLKNETAYRWHEAEEFEQFIYLREKASYESGYRDGYSDGLYSKKIELLCN